MGNSLMSEAYVRIHKARKGSKKSMKSLSSTGMGKKWDSQRGETLMGAQPVLTSSRRLLVKV